jgi:hypothetical protein
MLLLEFLMMGRGLPPDDPLACWDREQLRRQFAAWRARSDPRCARALFHLDPAIAFDVDELQRPSSVDLALELGLSLPQRRVLRRSPELPRPVPAVLGPELAILLPESDFRPPTAPKPRYVRRLSRIAQTIKPFYARQKAPPKAGDQDLQTLFAIAIGLLSILFWIAFLVVFASILG